LPDGLIGLNCTDNKLAELPPLPVTLKGLDFTGIAFFTALETRASHSAGCLSRLYCSHNGFKVLPILPDGLIGLDCSYNSLAAPPTLLVFVNLCRFAFARCTVFGEISMPVKCLHLSQTRIARRPVPTPISKTDLSGERSNASMNASPSHLSM